LDRDDAGVGWLLQSKDPSVLYFTLTDVLGEPEKSSRVVEAKRQIPRGARLRALFSGERANGGFGVHWYRKWTGPHWRLVSAVELGVPAGDKAALKAANYVLRELSKSLREDPAVKVGGLWRVHASESGNTVGYCSRLGIADDPRVEKLAHSLVEWQWPDGGWNCVRAEDARHSTFYHTLHTLWGLNEYYRATGDEDVRKAVEKAAELLLEHHLFKSTKSGETIHPEWVKLHYPLYWHYDILRALRILGLAGKLRDLRTAEALNIIESKRSKEGTWSPEGHYWHLKDGPVSSTFDHPHTIEWDQPRTEVVDWGWEGPNEMLTLNALRVLVDAGRLS
jgi:hypothetical protein